MKNIFKALANFQQECPTIHKGTQGYGYSYADLPTILDVINPLLKKNGLGFTQLLDGNNIRSILFHIESGETLESSTEIPIAELKGMNVYQSAGSGITYYRRYALSSMLGIVTDKDTDATGETKKTELKPGSNEWNKAVDYLVDGGDINKIRLKYTIKDEIELLKEVADKAPSNTKIKM